MTGLCVLAEMKRLGFYLVFSSLVTIPAVVLISSLALGLLTYGSLHKPESFAKHGAGWMPLARDIYFSGVVNILQSDKNCAVYDDALL